MHVKPGSDTYLTLCFRVVFRYEFVWNILKQNQIILFALILKVYLQWNNISFNREIDLGKIMQSRNCIVNFSVDRNEEMKCHGGNAGQLGPRTTRTEISRPVSEDKSARKRGLVGPYVKTTRTVLLFYNIVQYLYVYNYLFI
jgi:hypothetical protein